MNNHSIAQAPHMAQDEAAFAAEAQVSVRGAQALAYSEAFGWLVIPANAKRPTIKWNARDLPAVPPREVQLAWWRRFPRAQMALVTGARSRVVVVDADPRHGGSLETCYTRGWPRETPTARSGSCVAGDGGGHAFYAYPDDGLGVPSAPKYATGCEVKADGAIVVLAPSLHHVTHRFYRWLDGRSPWELPLAPIPAAVLAELRAGHTTRRRHRSRSQEGGAPALVDVAGLDIGWSRQRVRAKASRFYRMALWRVRNQGEGRNTTLFWLSGQLLALGFSGDELCLWAEAFAEEVGGEV